ncbi:MAG: DNA polymerase III subunit gamma/tau [Immundisolibacterales bacterium]|nr:DNA polymerase III subunit gamma/tau [Immundisolibacterales bacterium]
MSYQALARKWRPRSFDAIVGQEHVVRALVNAFERDRLHHAYLFSGTRGVGKTTIARVFAKGLNCEQGPAARTCGECGACREVDEGRHIDLIEVDAASRARVEETRDLLDNVQYAPVHARFKVYLIDEVHMFSRHSFNALLKTLEEPPPHVKFLLATTDPQRLPVTILSRCLQFGLRRLSVEEIAGELGRIAREEEIEVDPPALRVLGRAADGSMRDALSLLDQATAYGAGRVSGPDVRALIGTVGRERLLGLLEALAACDAAAMVEALDGLAGEAADFETVLGEIIEALGRMAALQVVPGGREDDEEVDALRALAARIPPEALQLHYQIATMGRRDLPFAPHPRTGFEMTMLRMAAFAPAAEGSSGTRQRGGAPQSVPASAEPPSTRGAPTGGGEPAPRSDPENPLTPPAPAAAPLPYPDPVPDPDPAPALTRTPDEGPASVPAPASISPPAPDFAAAPAATPTPDPEPEPGSEIVQSAWSMVCARLGLKGVARQLAANCTVRRHSRGTVELDLSSEQAQLLNSGTRARLESALSEYLGEPTRLRVNVGIREDESPAERDRREEQERIEQASRDLGAVPDYQDLLERFEGNTTSILPPE